MPPAALMRTLGPTCAFMSATSATVAPPDPYPVEVFTKSTPISVQISQSRIFSASARKQHSKITFRTRPAAWTARQTAAMSRPT